MDTLNKYIKIRYYTVKKYNKKSLDVTFSFTDDPMKNLPLKIFLKDLKMA